MKARASAVEVGDVWRNKKTGVHVRVVDVNRYRNACFIRIKATGAQSWSTGVNEASLFERYELTSYAVEGTP